VARLTDHQTQYLVSKSSHHQSKCCTDSGAELGSFVHDVEGEMFCESSNPKIPYFNAPIYLENKVHIPDFISGNMAEANVRPDTYWQSRRDPRTDQPGLLHDKDARRHTGKVIQEGRQGLHWRRQATSS
jgi:hypothetical protein